MRWSIERALHFFALLLIHTTVQLQNAPVGTLRPGDGGAQLLHEITFCVAIFGEDEQASFIPVGIRRRRTFALALTRRWRRTSATHPNRRALVAPNPVDEP